MMSEFENQKPRVNHHGIRDMRQPMYCVKCQSNERPKFEQRGSSLFWYCQTCGATLEVDHEDDDICG